jgi:hypothetical protein
MSEQVIEHPSLPPYVPLPSAAEMVAEIESGYPPLRYPTLADVEETVASKEKAAAMKADYRRRRDAKGKFLPKDGA